MSDPLDIAQSGAHSGQRLVWVFAFEGPLEELEAMPPEALAEALGLWAAPDMAHVERFDLASMRAYGFARYLSEANGFDIDAEAARLEALTGPVLLVFSKALNEKERRFAPEPPFAVIARYAMPHDPAPLTGPLSGLESESARGQIPQGKPPKSPARISGMVATFVLVFLAVFVALFVWIGG